MNHQVYISIFEMVASWPVVLHHYVTLYSAHTWSIICIQNKHVCKYIQVYIPKQKFVPDKLFEEKDSPSIYWFLLYVQDLGSRSLF